LFKESITYFEGMIASIPAYQKRVEQLTKDGMDQIAAVREAHEEFIKGRFIGLSGKKLRFMAKQRADILLAEETRRGA
jgi:hypothetical protein